MRRNEILERIVCQLGHSKEHRKSLHRCQRPDGVLV
jgi:hypothetical protein